ncbi:unnamed protein product [Periconia digitata]|uniref:Uncharacterized protein n=1 Tax=Periconia digitata TaxID=1303443 RepID=A0A9W4UJW1_9PLEO|nr:unnamed protein product [Periconia digitata]
MRPPDTRPPVGATMLKWLTPYVSMIYVDIKHRYHTIIMFSTPYPVSYANSLTSLSRSRDSATFKRAKA